MRATTVVADDATRALDLNDIARGDGFLFVRDGVGLAGRGVARRVPFDEAPSALAAIAHDDRTPFGVSPVGIGWIPFVPGEPGEVVIPRVAVVKSDTGDCWVTRIEGDGSYDAQLAPTGQPIPTADSYRIEQVTPAATYLAAVAAARDAVQADRLVKAVIARGDRCHGDASLRPPRHPSPAQVGVRAELSVRRRWLLRRLAGATRRRRPSHGHLASTRRHGTAGG